LRRFAGPASCDTPSVNIRDNRQLVAALLDVSGVSGASIESTGAGPGTLRLQLAAGSDQVIVAGEVNRLLRSKFGLAVDPDRVRVIDEIDSPAPVPGLQGSGSVLGKHAVADSGADTAVDTAADTAANTAAPPSIDLPVDLPMDLLVGKAAGSTGDDGARTTDEARRAGSTPAIGAYARDAIGIATILSTDQRIAHGATGTNGATHQAAPNVTLTRPSRLSIERVQLVSAGLGTAVTVTLGLDGRSLEGEAEGAATQSGLLRSVAAATLRAIERVIDGTVRFEVEHVEVARIGIDQTALVVITMLTGRSAQRLSGASVVREDTREAVIRAVLAALNRRMEPLLADR
jgi:hypothetical protein